MLAYLPDNNLNFPVLIKCAAGSSSGFYLNTATETFLVTAKHALIDGTSGLPIASIVNLISYTGRFTHQIEITADLSILSANGDLRVHATADVAVIKIGTIDDSHTTATLSDGVDMISPGVEGQGLTGVSLQFTRRFADAGISNEAFIFGYPISLGQPGQLEPTKPLIRKGVIAGLNTINQTIVVDAPVYQGNSGGLVIEVDIQHGSRTYRAVGVMCRFVPFIELTQSLHFKTVNTNWENSGYSIAEPMDRVFELL